VNYVSKDGTCCQFASGYEDGTVSIWSTLFSSPIHSFQGHSNAITTMAYDLFGNLYTGSKDGTVKVWQGFKKCKNEVKLGTGISSLTVNNSGLLMVIGLDDGYIVI